MMDKTEELETWDQILSLDDISKGNSDPSKVPTRDTTPGQWDCSSYLSRSKSGYFGGTNNSARKSVSSSLSTEKTGIRFDLNSGSLSWFPSTPALFRGASEGLAHKDRAQGLATTSTNALKMGNIFDSDVAYFHQGTDENLSPAKALQASLPTYDSNPWSVPPKPADFVCNWSADAFDTSPGRPTNARNARIRASLDHASKDSLPVYLPQVNIYYLKQEELVDTAADGGMEMIKPLSPFRIVPTCNTKPLVYQVHFKHYYRDYLLHPFVKTAIRVGDVVRADADRGEDVGHVIAVSTMRCDHPTTRLGYIFRLATAEEKYMLPIKAKEEWEALEVCKKVTFDHQLAMNILDAEYQFDRRKLTFFFEAGGRIDFRTLVPSLFAIYKTRIWMQQVQVNINGDYESVFA